MTVPSSPAPPDLGEPEPREPTPDEVDFGGVPADGAAPRRRARVRKSTRSTSTPPAASGAAPIEPAEALPTVEISAVADAAPNPEATSSARAYPRFDVPLSEERIDPDVQKVVRRLVRHGYEAYLVGGCVRDLLLGRIPKDFDVATSARPEQVRELFRNSRVIGKRFRLVHVLFHGGKVIEVATFRRNPQELEADDPTDESANLLIRSDNVFGEAHEDALRRDFTINALFYDLESHQILDWVGGLADVQQRVVNTIGEPNLRFREDPVRILRALKFAGRLELGIAPDVYDAIVSCRGTLDLAARPRVAEEILRLMRGGGARRTIYLAWEVGVLELLLPELAALLYDSFDDDFGGTAESPAHRVFRLLEYIDRRTAAGAVCDDTVLWTCLLLEPLKEATEGARDRTAAALEFMDPLLERLAIPKRFANDVRRIVTALPRLLSGRAGRFARSEIFSLAVDVAEADTFARGLPLDRVRALREPQLSVPPAATDDGNGRRSSVPRPADDDAAPNKAANSRSRTRTEGRARPTQRSH
ncbi:MAG: polynucleotide adenylyltransferase PcnB [Polyangiaceae bacterium]